VIGILVFGDSSIQAHRIPEANAKGEPHPIVKQSSNLDEWIDKHCDEDTIKIKDKIKWYAEYSKIKPETVFAIVWADTQCGKKLTTKYNYGNVGNNDRGDRIGFQSAFAGWQAVIDTLNNKYLKGNTMIGQLSNGGRKMIKAKYICKHAIIPYKCYASSWENHINNMLRALDSMGYNSSAKYPIRI